MVPRTVTENCFAVLSKRLGATHAALSIQRIPKRKTASLYSMSADFLQPNMVDGPKKQTDEL